MKNLFCYSIAAACAIMAACNHGGDTPTAINEADSEAIVIIEQPDTLCSLPEATAAPKEKKQLKTETAEIEYSKVDTSVATCSQDIEVEDALNAVMSAIASSVKSGQWDIDIKE
ncbi:MAG: hypothetical protein IJK84_04820 [Bacteroidales bacterium]|nr:hypothetical protein [Bacteroidales bacterium]